MQKIKKILIATDLSDPSLTALKKGLEFAKRFKANITVLHVLEQKTPYKKWWKSLLPTVRKDILKSEDQIQSLLHRKIAAIRSGQAPVEIKIISGKKPAIKIVNFTKNNNYDLLIIGKHGRYTLHDWFIGTSAEYIIKKIHCPVLIINQINKPSYKNILLPIDFSEASQKALKFASDFFPQSRFYILNVADYAYDDLVKDDYAHLYSVGKKFKKELLGLLMEKMQQFITENTKKINYFTKIKIGFPGLVILKEAKKPNESLIIMGTRGHSKKHYNWLGSVANHVLIDVKKDILFVPSTKKSFKKKKPTKADFLKKIQRLTDQHFKELKELVKK